MAALIRPADGFREPRETIYEYNLQRSVNDVVGYVFSLSWASKYQLADQAEAFERELRASLSGLLAAAGAPVFDDRVAFLCLTAIRT